MDPITAIFVITAVLGTGLTFAQQAFDHASDEKRNKIINIANKVLSAMRSNSNNFERYADTLQTILSTTGTPSSRVARLNSATEAYKKYNSLRNNYNEQGDIYNKISNILNKNYITSKNVSEAEKIINSLNNNKHNNKSYNDSSQDTKQIPMDNSTENIKIENPIGTGISRK